MLHKAIAKVSYHIASKYSTDPWLRLIYEKLLAQNEHEAKQMLDILKKHGFLHFCVENQVFMGHREEWVRMYEALIK